MSLALAALALAACGLLQGRPRPRAGLLLAALLLGLVAGLEALLRDAATAPLAATGAWHGIAGAVIVSLLIAGFACPRPPTVALAAWAIWSAWPILVLPPMTRTIGAAAAILALAVLGGALVQAVRPGRLLLALDRTLLDPSGRAAWRPDAGWVPTAWLLVAATATGAALVVPHLATVLGGALVAFVAAFAASRRGPWTAWGLLPAVPVLAWMLLWTMHLGGPLGGWIPALVDGPFSPRAAWLLAGLSGLVVSLGAGLWPWHGFTIPVLLAPVSVAVGGTFAVMLVPDGVQWWQPLAAPLAVVAAGHAVATGRAAGALVATGVYGLWTGTQLGAIGGALLITSGWVVCLAPRSWLARLPWPPRVLPATWIIPAAGLLAVLHAGVRGELAYTILLVAVVATGVTKLGRVEHTVDPSR